MIFFSTNTPNNLHSFILQLLIGSLFLKDEVKNQQDNQLFKKKCVSLIYHKKEFKYKVDFYKRVIYI